MFDEVPNLSKADRLRASCPLGAGCYCAEAMERGQVADGFSPMFGFVLVVGADDNMTIDEFMSLVAMIAFYQMMTEDDQWFVPMSAPEPARTPRQRATDFFRGLWSSRKGSPDRDDILDAELVPA